MAHRAVLECDLPGCGAQVDVGKYRTIVADPPWFYEYASLYPGRPELTKPMPYPMMSVDEIAALRVGSLAERDAHLYLWTTQRYLDDSFRVLEAWGFQMSAVLVWSKRPRGFVGSFVCSAEFVLFGRRGTLATKRRQLGTVYEWPRRAHSAKPEAFIDLVESMSPGPYVELFSRRHRLGWDVWGNESANTAQMEVG